MQIPSTDVPKAIADAAFADSNVVVPAVIQGAVRKVVVGIGRITHTFVDNLTLSLLSPTNHRRNLVVNRGDAGMTL